MSTITKTKEWTDATTASYLVSSQVETPMASGIAFASADRGGNGSFPWHDGDGLDRIAGEI